MNRRGNLRRGESAGRNVSEKHEHGRQSGARRVSSGGATQKRRPVQPPTREKPGERRGNLRRRESAGWTDGEISVEGKAPGGRQGNLHRGKAPGENLLEKHEHGKAKQGAQGIVQGRNAEAQAGAASDTGKSRAGGGRIFTEGKRQMNRRGNLRRGESAGRNVSEKHEHGRQSGARRVSSGGAMQKRRPVQPPTREKAGRPTRESSQRGKRQMNRRGNLRRRESTGRNVSEKHEHGRRSEARRAASDIVTRVLHMER